MSLDNIVNLTISRSAAAVSRQGFGTALILGLGMTGWGSDRIRSYNDPAEMLEDGFDTGDLEYKEAVSLYAQPVKPSQFKVGRRLTAQAQVSTLTPDVTDQSSQHYIVTLNGQVFDFTSDATPTAAEVVTGLAALINAASQPVTASGTNTLVLTADAAGIAFSVDASANLANAATTPNIGIQSDLSEIAAVDNDWYGLILCDRGADNIMEAAAWIEARRKVFVACSEDAGIVAAGSADLGSRLKAKGYNRTLLVFSRDSESGPEGAVLGNILPRPIGSYTVKFKTLVGITADNLTATEYNVARSKNVNIHTVVAGAGMLEEGIVASGEFLDTIIGIDWLHVNMQADVFQLFRDNPKVPYTNDGTALVQSKVENRLRLGVVQGILAADPAYVVTVPLITEQDPADKATRTLGNIRFTAYLAGAVHNARINGSVLIA